jgi:hypothetical protein
MPARLRAAGRSAQSYQSRTKKVKEERLLDRFFATTRAKLREISKILGVRHVLPNWRTRDYRRAIVRNPLLVR